MIEFPVPVTAATGGVLMSGCLKLRRFSKDGLFGWEPKQCQLVLLEEEESARFEFGDKVVHMRQVREIQRKDSKGLRFDLK